MSYGPVTRRRQSPPHCAERRYHWPDLPGLCFDQHIRPGVHGLYLRSQTLTTHVARPIAAAVSRGGYYSTLGNENEELKIENGALRTENRE